jgi:WhiB family redox-sensing transcriptional regulator
MATWTDAAACRGEDPELFFPIGKGPEFASEIEEAKQICAACPVRSDCLQDALDVPHKSGIWGGVDEWEREHMRRRQQHAASARRIRAARRAEREAS